ELFSKTLGQLLCDEASEYVGRTAGRKRNDDAHWPRRIGLRPRDARHGRERGGTGCQMQKSPTVGKFHCALRTFRATVGFPHSLRFDAGRPDHFRPLFGVACDKLPEGGGVSGIGTPPRSRSRCFILGSARAALISLLSFSTISIGVLLGAPIPCHPLA